MISWLVAGLYLLSAGLALLCCANARHRLFAGVVLAAISVALAADEVWNLHRILGAAVRDRASFGAPARLLLWLALGTGTLLAVAKITWPLVATADRMARTLLTLWLVSLLLLLGTRSADNALARAGSLFRTGNLGAAAKMVAALSLAGALIYRCRSGVEGEEADR